MTWQLMWHNVRVAALNATLQVLVIYRIQMIANPEVAKGDPRKPATVDQSRANEPIQSPPRPEPICWAVTESFHIQ